MTRSAFTAATALGIVSAFATSAWAGPSDDACAALMEARGALVSMLDAKDKAAQDELNVKVQAASGKLDAVLAGMSGADAKSAADFKVVWDQFKATRQADIIPAIYAGKADDAKKVATGVQAERMAKMKGIMSCK